MATSKLFITDTSDGISDGIVKNPDKEEVGRAWQHEAPVGNYIVVKLNNFWVVSEEDHKLIRQKKNGK